MWFFSYNVLKQIVLGKKIMAEQFGSLSICRVFRKHSAAHSTSGLQLDFNFFFFFYYQPLASHDNYAFSAYCLFLESQVLQQVLLVFVSLIASTPILL